jgi:hypothetical protein
MDSPTRSRSIVCTLCEGTYWHGAAVLVNSLHEHGYRGMIHVGYKGDLPAWFRAAASSLNENQDGGGTLRIVTTPITTPRHMTNFKPDFLLQLAAQDAVTGNDGIFYFDPDIVNKAPWAYYERWIRAGVALCEDVNSPMYARHPLRQQWREYYGLPAASAETEPFAYFNAGFVGLRAADLAFLETWKSYQDLAEQRGVNLCSWGQSGSSRAELFPKVDQDFMNVAAMTYPDRLTPMGKEGMDFVHGGQLMSHAIGRDKPWNTSYVRVVFSGRKPRLVDHQYWRYTQAPIRAHSRVRQRFARLELVVAGALGRVIA